MNPTPEQIRDYIEQGMSCQHVKVDGDGQHFQAVIVSAAFEGLRLVQRMGGRISCLLHCYGNCVPTTPARPAQS